MRKTLVFLALIGASALFLTPTTASAKAHHRAVVGSNCPSVWATTIWYDGYWRWNFGLQYCTAVNAAEFATPNGSQGYTVYLSDINHYPPIHFSISGGGVIYGVYSVYYTTYTNIPWGPGCGSGTFLVQQSASYRIRNANNNQWGSWHQALIQPQPVC